MSLVPLHLHYEFDGRQEYCLSFGDTKATRNILIVPPLFDEMNRTRAMLVGTMRDLAARGVKSLLPDLPGCNESCADMSAQTVDSWRAAMAAAARTLGATHVASIRGGTLIDDAIALPHWRLVPGKGASLLKTMLRTRIASDKESDTTSTAESLLSAANHAPVQLSGYMMSAAMLFSLDNAAPASLSTLREVTLGDDSDDAITGTPLWLRAEPQSDAAMSVAIAADLDRWSTSCGG